MSKSILVIDTPKSCEQCEIFNFSDLTCLGCKVNFKDVGKVQSWCPLKPMPEKKPLFETVPSVTYMNGKAVDSYAWGWNTCIRTIVQDEGEEK